MDAGLLVKLFGPGSKWSGPCVLVLDADAKVDITGTDSLVQGGVKMYAPRITSGRIEADAVCLLPEASALLLVIEEEKHLHTGEDETTQRLTVVDFDHIAAVEFADLNVLDTLGVERPDIEERHEYRPGTLIG